MNKQSIIIYDFQILFNILNEIKENLKFKVFNFNKDKKITNLEKNTYGNYLIAVNSFNYSLEKNVEKNKLFLIKNLPVKIDKLIEKINIQLLKQKYNYQSEIQINKYKLNLN